MATTRNFGVLTSDRLNCGSIHDDATSITIAGWVRATTLTNARTILSKAKSSAGGWAFNCRSTGDLDLEWQRATQNTIYRSNTAPLTVNRWFFTAVTADQTGPAVKLYAGSPTALATETTYGTTQNGSGAYTSDAANNLFVGNRDWITPSLSWQGQVAIVGQWHNRILLPGEIRDWQERSKKYLEGLRSIHSLRTDPSMVLLMPIVGANPEIDYSGYNNHGIPGGTRPSLEAFPRTSQRRRLVHSFAVAGGVLWHPGMTGGMRDYRGGMRG